MNADKHKHKSLGFAAVFGYLCLETPANARLLFAFMVVHLLLLVQASARVKTRP